MNIYIRSASCISPQQTFGADRLPAEAISFSVNRLQAIEPDYKIHLNIPAARRMSRLIKMGVCAALSCLRDANVKVPDAIICSTGLGCMEDSEKFLASLIVNNEHTLSPTSFIFSTHNTVAGQIALLLQCNNYNFTHTHRGLSFENALLDAILFIKDNPASNVLVGSGDEVTNTSFKILERLGVVKKETDSNSLPINQTSGTIAGEGSAFFTLTGKNDENNLAKIVAVESFSNPGNDTEVSEKVADFIERHKISSGDLILLGLNGDVDGDKIYHEIAENQFPNIRTGSYKHLCGEYHTSTSFACWLSALILKEQKNPAYILSGQSAGGSISRIFIFNQYKGREFSQLLLEKC